jgi:hypothetical protein
MSTTNSDISGRLVGVIRPLLQSAATSCGDHLQICKAITPFQPSGSSIGEVLRKFANISSRVATDVRTFRWKTDYIQVLLRIASSNNLKPHNILVQYEVVSHHSRTLLRIPSLLTYGHF